MVEFRSFRGPETRKKNTGIRRCAAIEGKNPTGSTRKKIWGKTPSVFLKTILKGNPPIQRGRGQETLPRKNGPPKAPPMKLGTRQCPRGTRISNRRESGKTRKTVFVRKKKKTSQTSTKKTILSELEFPEGVIPAKGHSKNRGHRD